MSGVRGMKQAGLALAVASVLCASAAPAWAQAQDGKTLFAKNCAACHQLTGAGIPQAFPPLKGSAFVQGEANTVIATVLKGRGGMPTFAKTLDDEQLALVIRYARQSWGNKASPVTPQDIKAVRELANTAEFAKPQGSTNVH